MKCSRCGRNVTEEQSHVYQGKVMCDDCLMDIGLSVKDCDPWATYVDTRQRQGLNAAEGLSEMEKKVYEFVKRKGKATRKEVMKNLRLSEADLNAQLLPLMHSDLLKEHAEGDKTYLIPIV
jgi:DNA-directed RNA polymerase specialized sigma subunit